MIYLCEYVKEVHHPYNFCWIWKECWFKTWSEVMKNISILLSILLSNRIKFMWPKIIFKVTEFRLLVVYILYQRFFLLQYRGRFLEGAIKVSGSSKFRFYLFRFMVSWKWGPVKNRTIFAQRIAYPLYKLPTKQCFAYI